MIKKILKIVIGIILIPIDVFLVMNFCKEITAIPLLTAAQAMFLYGIAAYVAVHIFIIKPDFLYVFGHESTHALTAKFLGGKIFDFKVSSKGGSVKTDKVSTAVALTPYIIPFYTILVFLVYLGIGIFRDAKPYSGYFIFALGATLAFHLVQTAEHLKQKQPDIIKSGYIFSMPLVIFINIAVTAGILSFVFMEFSFKQMALATFEQVRDLYIQAWQQVFR